MVKMSIPFQTKTAQTPYPLELYIHVAHTYKGVTAPPFPSGVNKQTLNVQYIVCV